MMSNQRQKLPRTESSLRIGKAVARLKKMPMADRIQLMVKAKLITQEQADEAKSRLIEKDVPTSTQTLAP
jgi:hypothetical protein